MAKLPKLAPKLNLAGQQVGWGFFCEGCSCMHWFRTVPDVSDPHAPVWTLTGDAEKPTFSSSLRVEGEHVCHLIMTDGKIHWLADSTHKYAGRIRPLADWPFNEDK